MTAAQDVEEDRAESAVLAQRREAERAVPLQLTMTFIAEALRQKADELCKFVAQAPAKAEGPNTLSELNFCRFWMDDVGRDLQRLAKLAPPDELTFAMAMLLDYAQSYF